MGVSIINPLVATSLGSTYWWAATVNFFHLVGLTVKLSKILLCRALDGEAGLYGLPRGLKRLRIHLQFRRCKFNPWVRKIPTFTFHCHALEEEMATHSSVLSWEIPWTEKPSGLESLGSLKV